MAYSDFFNEDGTYKLREYVRQAYNTPKKDRGVFEKEMMKLDEKVNICSMVFSGSFMKVFPIPGDVNNTWESPAGGHQHQSNTNDHDHGVAKGFYNAYMDALRTGNWQEAYGLLNQLDQYQKQNGREALVSDRKRNAELLLNRINVFSRLGKAYSL